MKRSFKTRTAFIIAVLMMFSCVSTAVEAAENDSVSFSFGSTAFSVKNNIVSIGSVKYYKTSEPVSSQEYIIGCKRNDESGLTDALTVYGDGANLFTFTYDLDSMGGGSAAKLNASEYALTASSEGLKMTASKKQGPPPEMPKEGAEPPKPELLSEPQFEWKYENDNLFYTNGEETYYLSFIDGVFSSTDSREKAAEITLYTSGEVLNRCFASQPQAVNYELVGSGYNAPVFSADLTDKAEFDSVTWYVDGEVQPDENISFDAQSGKTVFEAESLKGKEAGVYRVCCTAFGIDENNNYYRETSDVVNFVVCNGVEKNSFITFSDIHEEFEKTGEAIEEFMIDHNGKIPALVICTGDFNNGATASVERMEQEIIPAIRAQLGGLDAVFVSGNHEASEASVKENILSNLGATEDFDDGIGVIFDSASKAARTNGKNSRNTDGLVVYGLNFYGLEQTDSEENKSYTYEGAVEQLEGFLSERAKNYNGEPIVISSHTGLHVLGVQPESTNQNGENISEWGGSNQYNLTCSDKMVELLNKYADKYKMDIIFLFGHDHSRSEVEMTLKPGDKIISTVDSSEKTFTEQTLRFTYAHAGYLSGAIGSADYHYVSCEWNTNTINIIRNHLGDKGESKAAKTEVDSLTPVIVENKITLPNSSYTKIQGKKQTVKLNASALSGNISYSSNTENVTVSASGIVTIKKNYTGRAVITVKATGKFFTTAAKKVVIAVKPKTVTAKAKRLSAKKMKVTWNKGVNVTGYQVQYSSNKSFKKATSKLSKKNSLTVGKLSKSKTYYVRVRAYKAYKINENSKRLYSAWSKKLTVKRV